MELGKASTALNAPVVELSWRNEPESVAIGVERLEEETFTSADPIQFLAGREWRLLGTYNPLDAQRVFRFGQALARRFVEIPIPAPSVSEFLIAFSPQVADLPAEISYKLSKIYEAHWSDTRTQLGPAIFFKAIPYIRSSFNLPAIATISTADESEASPSSVDLDTLFADTEESTDTVEAAAGGGAATGETEVSPITQIVTEAYLASAGKYLAKLEEEELDRLGERIIASGAFPRSEWEWIRQLLPDLA
ncbi:MAG: hypothetical protein M3362_06440 [Acidobacteriota bacterium]|nr:hypothetical protein [Acidobacteriota bacterium]